MGYNDIQKNAQTSVLPYQIQWSLKQRHVYCLWKFYFTCPSSYNGNWSIQDTFSKAVYNFTKANYIKRMKLSRNTLIGILLSTSWTRKKKQSGLREKSWGKYRPGPRDLKKTGQQFELVRHLIKQIKMVYQMQMHRKRNTQIITVV